MSLTLTLHGTGAGTPSGSRMASALSARFADGSIVLFDAGEGCSRAMIRDGVDINRIVTVAISHMHADHWCGLPGLVTGWGTLGRGPDTAEVLVPHAAVAFLEESLRQSMLFPEVLPFTVDVRDLVPFDLRDGWRVELFTTSHLAKVERVAGSHGIAPAAYGYRLISGDRAVVLSQDIGSLGDLTGVVDGAELLVCESAHVDPPELLEMAHAAGVRRVVFTHVSPGAEESFPDRFDGIEWCVATDGMTIPIE